MSERGTSRGRWGLLGTAAALVFVADQLTKWWAVVTLDDQTIHIVWTLQLRLTRNFGSAFSLAQGRGALISLLALVAVGFLLATGRRATRPLPAISLGLIVGGAIGNLADRLFRAGDGFLGGGVVDFIDFQWWPVFNVADTGVVVGACLLVLTTSQGSPEDARDPEGASEPQPGRE